MSDAAAIILVVTGAIALLVAVAGSMRRDAAWSAKSRVASTDEERQQALRDRPRTSWTWMASHVTARRGLAIYGVLALLVALLLFTSAPAHAQRCPDISGVYALVGTGDVVDDVRRVLGVHAGAPVNSRVLIEGGPEDDLSVTVTPHNAKPYLTVALKRGVSFSCQDGRIVFTQLSYARRRTDKGTYEGKATVRLGREKGGDLAFEITFSGNQSSTLYSYDSARVKVPIPFSSTILRDRVEWPAVRPFDEPVPEPPEVLAARAMLDDKVLGTVTLNTLRISGDGVLATMSARTNDDVARLEDRLRAASIPFEMKGPRWNGAGYYELQLLVRPRGPGAAVPSRPSAHRVEQELNRTGWPNFYIKKVEAQSGAYVATLGVEGSGSVEEIISLIKKNTTLFADIRPLTDPPRQPGSRSREVQIQLLVR